MISRHWSRATVRAAIPAAHHQRHQFHRAEQAQVESGAGEPFRLYQEREIGGLRPQQGDGPAAEQEPEVARGPQRC